MLTEQDLKNVQKISDVLAKSGFQVSIGDNSEGFEGTIDLIVFPEAKSFPNGHVKEEPANLRAALKTIESLGGSDIKYVDDPSRVPFMDAGYPTVAQAYVTYADITYGILQVRSKQVMKDLGMIR